MTPTTITRADDLATAAEEIIQVLDIALSCGVISHGNEHIKNGPRGKMIAALAAYRAARSTEESASLPKITGSELADLMYLCGLIDSDAICDYEDYDRGATLSKVDKLADKINAARAASGSGEKG